MIQYGMRCHDICPKAPLTEVLDCVRENGIQHIQLALSKSVSDYDFSLGHYSAGFGGYIGRELVKRQIHVAVLGCYINPVSPDERAREAAVDRFIEHLRYAKRLGADMVGTETGRFSVDFAPTPLTDSEECYEILKKSFARILKAAHEIGVTVGVEGVYNHTLSTPEKMRRFLEDMDSENLEVILDGVNLIPPAAEFDPAAQKAILEQAFSLYGDRISVLHLKDFVFDGENQLYRHPGEGHFSYESLLTLVKEKKPMIIGLLENSTPDRYAQDCAYIQKIYECV